MKNHQVYDSQMSSDASFWIKRADTWFSQHTGRTQLPVTVAKISTLEEVKKMFAESGNDTNITQIVMCGGLAGLLYSHATDQVGLKQRMLEVRRRHDIDMKSLLPPLYHEFCTGNEEDSLTKSGFRVFTYHDENYKPIWPLMCVNEFLEICDRRDCSSLIKYSLTKATLPEEGDGKMWEYVVGAGILTLLHAVRTGLELSAIQKICLGPKHAKVWMRQTSEYQKYQVSGLRSPAVCLDWEERFVEGGVPDEGRERNRRY
eukprot:m.274817 g.274817  ORF g.274817 m.274817 type:complete len:259 (+) comp16290_c0_seq53:504-1280(+)